MAGASGAWSPGGHAPGGQQGRPAALGVPRLAEGRRGATLAPLCPPAQQGALWDFGCVHTLSLRTPNRLSLVFPASHQLRQLHGPPGAAVKRGSSTGFAAWRVTSWDKPHPWSGLRASPEGAEAPLGLRHPLVSRTPRSTCIFLGNAPLPRPLQAEGQMVSSRLRAGHYPGLQSSHLGKMGMSASACLRESSGGGQVYRSPGTLVGGHPAPSFTAFLHSCKKGPGGRFIVHESPQFSWGLRGESRMFECRPSQWLDTEFQEQASLGLPSSGSEEVAENTSCFYKMTCPPRRVPTAPCVGIILDGRWASGLRPTGDTEVRGEKTGDFPGSSNNQPSWEWAPTIHGKLILQPRRASAPFVEGEEALPAVTALPDKTSAGLLEILSALPPPHCPPPEALGLARSSSLPSCPSALHVPRQGGAAPRVSSFSSSAADVCLQGGAKCQRLQLRTSGNRGHSHLSRRPFSQVWAVIPGKAVAGLKTQRQFFLFGCPGSQLQCARVWFPDQGCHRPPRPLGAQTCSPGPPGNLWHPFGNTACGGCPRNQGLQRQRRRGLGVGCREGPLFRESAVKLLRTRGGLPWGATGLRGLSAVWHCGCQVGCGGPGGTLALSLLWPFCVRCTWAARPVSTLGLLPCLSPAVERAGSSLLGQTIEEMAPNGSAAAF